MIVWFYSCVGDYNQIGPKCKAYEELHLEWLDVNKAFFINDNMEDDTCKAQPESALTVGKKNQAKTKKSVYGMKQASEQWYLKLVDFMKRCRYTRREMDHCYYLKKFSSSYIILVFNFDD